MIFIIFLVFIFLIFLFALIIPTHVIVSFDGKVSIKLKMFFITIPLRSLFKVKSKKKTKNSSVKKHKNIKSHKNFSFKSVLKKIKRIKNILKLSIKQSGNILKRLKIKELDIDLPIKGDDAADTAIKYGQISILASNLLVLLSENIFLEKNNIKIYPVFIDEDKQPYFHIDVSAKLIFILYELMIFSKNYVKISDEVKN